MNNPDKEKLFTAILVGVGALVCIVMVVLLVADALHSGG